MTAMMQAQVTHVLSKARPVAVLLVGIGGTGKSSAANELELLLEKRGYKVALIRFDELRKSLAPPDCDPFSSDIHVKKAIYGRAATLFTSQLAEGCSLVIDSGLSVESIRRQLKQQIRGLHVVHIECPFWISVWRDTRRSLIRCRHERGRFLHLHALFDAANPFKKIKFPQPGVTYPFEYPNCADIHVNTFLKSPRLVAEEIAAKLEL